MSETADLDKQVTELIRHFEVCLRSGYSLGQCFGLMGKDLRGKVGAEAAIVAAHLSQGTGLDAALTQFQQSVSHPDLDLFVASIRVQMEVGGNLADKLRLLNQILAQRTPTWPD